MADRIQIRANRYADAVAESIRAALRAAGAPSPDLHGDATVSQIATLSEMVGAEVSAWFPLRAAVS